MKASIVDLRYRMRDVLRALERNEEVTVLHRGTVKGTIVPTKGSRDIRASEHPLFGTTSGVDETVDETMDELREGRHRGI